MRVLLVCLIALGAQATSLDQWDDPDVLNAPSEIYGRQNVLLKRKQKTKVNNAIKKGDRQLDNVIPEPQEYIPPHGKQKALLSSMKNKRGKTKVNSEIKQYDNREALSDDVIPEPQEYIPPRGKQKALKSPMKNKRGKTKMSSEIKQYDNREALSDNIIPEPQEYVPPRGKGGKHKTSKLSSAFSTGSIAQGVQFIADIVTIASSDFWKWMDDVGW